MITIIPASAYRRMPWKNGQGETTEIAAEPGHGQFLWRVSIADVVRSGPFSAYPGMERWITVLEGAGMRLLVGEDPPRLVRTLDPPVCFPGDAATSCEIIDGAIRDFNLMLDRRHVEGRLAVLAAPAPYRLESETTLLFAVTRGVTVSAGDRSIELPVGDTALLSSPGGIATLDAGAAAIVAAVARRRGS